MTTELGGLAKALDLAFRELPAGPARSRLTQYCGRLWDLLRSSDLLEPERDAADSPWAPEPEIQEQLASSLTALATLVSEGIDSGQFAGVPARQTARLVLTSLLTRALWCRHPGVHPLLRGSCSHAVVETLELIWPALEPLKEKS